MMPTRLVVGEALWSSKKIRVVPEKYRTQYAWTIIPLAEANGCFECDPRAIWANCYAAALPSTTVEDVSEMLDLFEEAGMLERYEEDGKMFARPVNIDKPGRLPGKAHLARCKNLPPMPPGAAKANPPIGTVLDDKCKEYFNCREQRTTAYARKAYNDELKRAVELHGYDVLVEAFDQWGQSNYTGGYPVTAFLKHINANPPVLASTGTFVNPFAADSLTASASPTRAVEDRIALLSESTVFFRPQQRILLASLVEVYGDDLLVEVFREFYGTLPDDEYARKWASNSFVEQADTRCRALLRVRERRAEQEKNLEESLLEAQKEAQERLAAFQAEQNERDEL